MADTTMDMTLKRPPKLATFFTGRGPSVNSLTMTDRPKYTNGNMHACSHVCVCVFIAKAHDAGPGPQVRALQQGPVVAARAEAEPRARSAAKYAANRHAHAQTGYTIVHSQLRSSAQDVRPSTYPRCPLRQVPSRRLRLPSATEARATPPTAHALAHPLHSHASQRRACLASASRSAALAASHTAWASTTASRTRAA